MIAWHEAFAGCYESAWGISHKLAWLNHADPAEVLRIMLGFVAKPVDLTHGGRNYVVGHWLRERGIAHRGKAGARNRQAEEVLQVLHAHTGISLLGPLGSTLLTDQLRVCVVCLREGYHSIVHQIASLMMCPIHRVPLSTMCPECNQPLGEFGLRQTETGFACARCKGAWVDEDGVKYLPDAWRDVEARTIGVIAQWVRGLNDIHMIWPDPDQVPMFRALATGKGLGFLTNAQAFAWALHQISPLPLSQSLWCPEPQGLRVAPRGRPSKSIRTAQNSGSECRARLLLRVGAVIEATEQSVASIMRGHERCRYAAEHILNVHRDFRDPELSHDQALCPIGQGHYHWRSGIRSFATYLQDCFESAWIEPFEQDELPTLPGALLSSFYASVSAIVLFHELKRQGDPSVAEYLKSWRAPEDPWSLRRLVALPIESPKSHLVELDDPAILKLARCDKGQALVQFLNVARRCFDSL